MTKKVLPIEMLQKIFCSQLEIATLYNCLLVNRLWCKTVVPLLWQKPFSHFDKNKLQRWKYKSSLINTYVTCLDSKVKTHLKNSNVIIPEELNTTPTFNYASFLQSLDYVLLFQSTGNWIGETENCPLRKLTLRHYLLVEELCKLFFASSWNLKELIYDKPHSLPHVQELGYIPLRYLEGAERSMSKLVSFQVYNLIPNEILFTLSQISRHLSEIQIETTGDNDDALASLISVQKSLRKLVICSEEILPNLSDALKSISLSSLTHIEINWVFCIPFEVFCVCSDTLEYFSVQQYTGFISRSTFQQFSNTQFKKLHTLKIFTPKLYLDQVSTLIKNTKGSLQYIHLDYEKISTEFSVELINTISTSCPQLNTLEIFVPDDSIPCIVNLLSSCRKLQKISFFTGDSHDDFIENYSYTVDVSDMLPKIGKILPTNLRVFYMSHNWITSVNSLKDFLKECEKNLLNRGRRKLDFRVVKELSAEHIDVIEEFGKRGVLDLENTTLGRNLQFYRQQIEWKRNITVNRREALNTMPELT